MLTPTVVATAMLKAATAIAVRLKEVMTPRAAIRPGSPNVFSEQRTRPTGEEVGRRWAEQRESDQHRREAGEGHQGISTG